MRNVGGWVSSNMVLSDEDEKGLVEDESALSIYIDVPTLPEMIKKCQKSVISWSRAKDLSIIGFFYHVESYINNNVIEMYNQKLLILWGRFHFCIFYLYLQIITQFHIKYI